MSFPYDRGPSLRQIYDQRAYEEYQPDPKHGPRHLARKHRGIIARLSFPAGSRVLDTGCGGGVYCELSIRYWLEESLIHLPGLRRWGDTLLVKAVKP